MTLRLNGSSAGSVSLDAPSDTSPSGTAVSFTLPTADGSSGQVIQTNGSGALSFATPAAAYDNSPLVVLYQTAATSISHNTSTEYTGWTSEDDPDGVFASGRFTPTTAGRYLIIAGGFWSPNGKRLSTSLLLYKNGSTKISEDKSRPGSGDTDDSVNHHTSALVSLNGSSDYVSLFAYQFNYTDSAAVDINHVTMSIIRVGD